MEKLTCTQAKQIDLVGYLSALGYQPQKIRNQDYWFLSPLREEKTPSFKVNRKLNIWYDHASGKGGNIIDFGILHFKCSVSDLLIRLSAHHHLPGFSFQPPLITIPSAGEKKEASSSKILILEVRPLTEKSLIAYIGERKIPVDISVIFCKEVDFLLYGKKHTVIGFPNNIGGYELRSGNFKGSSSPKDLSLLINNRDNESINVLEGFTDFLSLLSLNNYLRKENFLVLNSLSFSAKGIELLKDFKAVSLFFDHDLSGRTATEDFLKALPQAKDASSFYTGHKDLNDYIRQADLLQQVNLQQVTKDWDKDNQDDAEKKQTQQRRKPPHFGM